MEVSGLWEIMCIEPVECALLVKEPSSHYCELLVDSGAYAHVCPLDFAPEIPLQSCQLPLVSTADGTKMTPLGRKTVPCELENGTKVAMTFVVLPVKRPILSVKALTQKGWTVGFGPNGALLVKGQTKVSLTPGFCLKVKFLEKFPRSLAPVHLEPLVAPVGPEVPGPGPSIWEEYLQAANAPAPVLDAPAEASDDEGQVPQRAPRPKGPTEEERRLHETTHVPFRSWCGACQAGKGRESGHFSGRSDEGLVIVQLDFFFLSSAEGDNRATPCLAAWVPEFSYGFARLYSDKTSERKKILDVQSFLNEVGLGGTPILVHSDGEPAIRRIGSCWHRDVAQSKLHCEPEFLSPMPLEVGWKGGCRQSRAKFEPWQWSFGRS